MDQQRLSGALSQNLLVLLCFSDDHCKQIRAAVTPQLFESAAFREVAGHAIDFIDLYGEAIKEHLGDELEEILTGDDQRKAGHYKKLLEDLYRSQDSVNAEYTVSQLHKFVRQQNLKSAFIKAAEAFEDGRIDEAEIELKKGLEHQVVVFEAGLNLSDADQMSGLLDELEEPGFFLGIPELDRRGLYPRRKEQTLFIAPRGKGKSWFCTHAAKLALIQGWTVVIISLEMSQKRYAARFLQSFFSISKRESHVQVAKFVHNRDGDLTDIVHENIERLTMNDSNIRGILASKTRREFSKRPPLIIKQFPTQAMTMDMLEAYLDGLERHKGITPDLLIVDYPDLAKHSAQNKRIELGQINERIRGIGVARNCATIVPSQGNRESEDARTVTGSMVAEDISKNATADLTFTLSQTPIEKKIGLARMFVEKSRNDEDKCTILMTQALGIGQFCLDSTMLANDYWEMPVVQGPRSTRRKKRDDDDEDDE